MAVIHYLNFDLQIERTEQGYCAHVLSSPAGEAEAEFVPPFSDAELEAFFAKMGESPPARAGDRTQLRDLAKDVGHRLFEAVFSNEVLASFRRSLDQARQKEQGLRLRLRLKNVPELATLPWEYLYNSANNLALVLSKKTPVVRYLDLPEPALPLAVNLPINVLVLIASPFDCPALDSDQEWFNLKAAFHKLESKGLVRVERLEEATLPMLQEKLRERKYHILHFIGHGGFDRKTEEGVLIFEGEEGKGLRVSGEQVGAILHDHATLRLAVINACLSAKSSTSDPFAGLAQSLIQQGLPAVIAMCSPVQDETAVTFTDNFYYFLTDGYPVEAALAETRKAILAKGSATAWAAPVLFMRSPDGRLFDFPAKDPARAEGQALPAKNTVYFDPALEVPTYRPKSARLRYAGAAFVLILSVLLAWPTLERIVLSKIIPEQKHLVVLPFKNLGEQRDMQAFSEGLMETFANRLTQMTRSSQSQLWVVPMSEVSNNRIATIEEARRNLGVNLAITGSLQRDHSKVHMTMNLVDAKSLRQINAATISLRASDLSAIPDEMVIKSAEMLNMHELRSQAQQWRAWQTGGTKVPAAYESYLKGRGLLLNLEHGQDATAARMEFQQAIGHDSLFARAYAGLGEAYWREFEKTAEPQWVEHAVRNCQRAVALNPELAEAHLTMSEIYLGMGQCEMALAESQKALALEPELAYAHLMQGRAYEELGRLAEAEAAYKKSIDMRPEHWRGYNVLGVFYYLHGRYAEAIFQFERVTALAPNNIVGYNNLGGIYIFLERFEEARWQFERSLEIQHNYEALSNLGALAFREGHFTEAAARYDQALACDSSDYQVWGNRAAAYYWSPGQEKRAHSTYRGAIARAEEKLRINPRDAEALADLSGYYARLDERNKALRCARRALDLAPDNTVVMVSASLTFEESGDRERALQLLEKALQHGYPLSEIEHEPGFAKTLQDKRLKKALVRYRGSP